MCPNVFPEKPGLHWNCSIDARRRGKKDETICSVGCVNSIYTVLSFLGVYTVLFMEGKEGARSMSDTGSPAQNSPTQTRRGHKAPRQTTARAAGGTAVADSPIVGSTAPDTRTTEPGAEGAGGADATGL